VRSCLALRSRRLEAHLAVAMRVVLPSPHDQGLGSRIDNDFENPSRGPFARCVRFAAAVAGDHATLATRPLARRSGAGLLPLSSTWSFRSSSTRLDSFLSIQAFLAHGRFVSVVMPPPAQAPCQPPFRSAASSAEPLTGAGTALAPLPA
jgi:hypothetical protein